MESEFQKHIDDISRLGLARAVEEIVALVPNLITSMTPGGTLLIHHPAYEGSAKLNDLGKIYLECSGRCITENAALEVRLDHNALEAVFVAIYEDATGELKESYKNAAVAPEGKFEKFGNMGRPDAIILNWYHKNHAFFFKESEYRRIWGSKEWCDTLHTWNEETLSTELFAVMASKKQVEEALAAN